jgi:nicotinate-nucleotide adenylyltransferase
VSPLRARRSKRLGVIGGTFDPPHLGHLAFAEWARGALRLDRVLFVPAGSPPHKRSGSPSPAAQRLAMTRLAVRGNPAFGVSALEVRRRGPSYTVDTLRALAARHPGARLHLLMGADMFASFGTWREPDEIARRARLVVALRPGAAPPRRGRRGAPAWARRVTWLANPTIELSSTALRERARRGGSLRYLVPDAVARYVERHRMYAPRRRRA